jgi:hypothetical protein
VLPHLFLRDASGGAGPPGNFEVQGDPPQMKSRIFPIVGLWLLSGCSGGTSLAGARPTASLEPVTEAELVQVAEALFAGMEARDTAAVRSLFLADAPLLVVRVREGEDPAVQTLGVSDFVASIGRSSEVLRERIWEPRVEVRGDFATLWAQYDFHQGERFSHCGVDAFHFVRLDNEWKIAVLSYTTQTAGCPVAPPPS